MPRRNRNARNRLRGAYRPEQRAALQSIEEKRTRLAVTLAELAGRTDISERTIRRAMKSGRAFVRHVKALQYALRTIEREHQASQGAMS
jgi:AraC-like DNA-binding protein